MKNNLELERVAIFLIALFSTCFLIKGIIDINRVCIIEALLSIIITVMIIWTEIKGEKEYKEKISNDGMDNINKLFTMGVNVPDKPNYSSMKEPWYLSVVFIGIILSLGLKTVTALVYGALLVYLKCHRKYKTCGLCEVSLEELSNVYHSTLDKCVKTLEATYRQKRQYEINIDVLKNNEQEAMYQLKEINKQCSISQQYLNELMIKMQKINAEVMSCETSRIQPIDENIEAEEYRNRVEETKIKYKKLMEKKNYGVLVGPLAIKGRTLENNIKKMLKIYNIECDSTIEKLSVSTLDSKRNKIIKAFQQVNNLFKSDGLELDTVFLKLKLEQLNNMYSYLRKKEIEAELRREEKERLRDEEKARKEIEERRRYLNNELIKYTNELKRVEKTYKNVKEKEIIEIYESEIARLKNKISELNKSLQDVENWEKNINAGYVYIISNIGSFGENVYKIGMTRRLEPMDRIEELSSASVPFRFDVHAMIFSDNAFGLEAALHKHFADKKINKVSERKEFYRVDLQEIKEVVHKNFNGTTEFTDYPMAEQYRRTLEIEKEIEKEKN